MYSSRSATTYPTEMKRPHEGTKGSTVAASATSVTRVRLGAGHAAALPPCIPNSPPPAAPASTSTSSAEHKFLGSSGDSITGTLLQDQSADSVWGHTSSPAWMAL